MNDEAKKLRAGEKIFTERKFYAIARAMPRVRVPGVGASLEIKPKN